MDWHIDHVAAAATLLRLLVGGFQIPHGLAKLGLLGPRAKPTAIENFGLYGLRPAAAWVFWTATAQVVLGVLMTLGLLTAPSALVTACMSLGMANVALKQNGWFWHRHGMEYAIFWAGAAFVVAELGPGYCALDNLLIR